MSRDHDEDYPFHRHPEDELDERGEAPRFDRAGDLEGVGDVDHTQDIPPIGEDVDDGDHQEVNAANVNEGNVGNVTRGNVANVVEGNAGTVRKGNVETGVRRGNVDQTPPPVGDPKPESGEIEEQEKKEPPANRPPPIKEPGTPKKDTPPIGDEKSPPEGGRPIVDPRKLPGGV